MGRTISAFVAVDDTSAVLDFLLRILSIAERAAADALDVPLSDVQMLRAVAEVGVRGGATGIERYFDYSHSTVTTAIKRLQINGLTSTLPFEEKATDGTVMKGRRTVAHILTSDGRALIASFAKREHIERQRVFLTYGITAAHLDALLEFVTPVRDVHRKLYSDEPSAEAQHAERALTPVERAIADARVKDGPVSAPTPEARKRALAAGRVQARTVSAKASKVFKKKRSKR